APQHRVRGSIDGPHAALTDLLLERVLSELADLADARAKAVELPGIGSRRHHGEGAPEGTEHHEDLTAFGRLLEEPGDALGLEIEHRRDSARRADHERAPKAARHDDGTPEQ